jgi:hypothetical protein
MGQSKIKSIQSTGTYNSKMDNALMYTFEVELESGEAGQVVAKTPDRWNVGDEVEFEKRETPYGVKLKLTKPGAQRGGGQSPELQKRIDASWAIGLARQETSDAERILELAEFYVNLRNTLISKL